MTTAVGQAVLIVEQLCAPRRGHRVLHDVHLEVRPGEVHALIGPNGAGKTTLLRTLAGLIRPASGTIDGTGRRAFVFEGHRFTPGCTVGHVLDRARALARVRPPGCVSSALADELVAALGVHDLERRRADRLSLGQRGRLGLAVGLIARPEVLFVDEPTTGLDPAGVRLVVGLLDRLRREGVAVVVSSHHLREIEGIADRATFLFAGAVRWTGRAADVSARLPPEAAAVVIERDGAVERSMVPLPDLARRLLAAEVSGGRVLDILVTAGALERMYLSFAAELDV